MGKQHRDALCNPERLPVRSDYTSIVQGVV